MVFLHMLYGGSWTNERYILCNTTEMLVENNG